MADVNALLSWRERRHTSESREIRKELPEETIAKITTLEQRLEAMSALVLKAAQTIDELQRSNMQQRNELENVKAGLAFVEKAGVVTKEFKDKLKQMGLLSEGGA